MSDLKKKQLCIFIHETFLQCFGGAPKKQSQSCSKKEHEKIFSNQIIYLIKKRLPFSAWQQ